MRFFGYPENHPRETFKVFDLKSEKPIVTRDVKWMNKTYGKYFGNNGTSSLENTELESPDEEIEIEFVKFVNEKEKENDEANKESEVEFIKSVEF
jgi:hypothetical protein